MTLILPQNGWADQHSDASSHEVATSANLDGWHLMMGPVASAVYRADTWDGAFGGELAILRVRERDLLGTLGLALGSARMIEAERHRVWTDLMVGTGRPLGLLAGLSAGVAAELDPVIPPRWGAQAALWVFLGVVPYVRLGVVQKNGLHLDFGLKVALPTIRI